MNCIIAGIGSDIGMELKKRLLLDGWEVEGVKGRDMVVPQSRWDMLILCYGQLSPIGKFFDCPEEAWGESVVINGLYPLNFLRLAWPNRGEKPAVIFIGGPNMLKPSPTYTAYRAGKAILEALVGTLASEYPEAKFRVLHPGVVKTKIHDQTLKAGHKAANYERVMKIVNGGESTISHDEVYQRLKAVL